MTVSTNVDSSSSGAPDGAAGVGAEPDIAGLPLERVEAEICTLAGQIAAATCRFLRLLAEFDAREGWAGWQVRSCAQWLSWRCGLDLRTAHEHIRVARALAGLPRVTEAFAQGQLSYSKVRALTRVATADTEADLVEAALCTPASQLERLLRGLQTATDDTSEPKPRRSGVQWRWDDDGSLKIWGRLDPDDGARLLAGLTRMERERTTTADAEPETTELAPDSGECSAEHPNTPARSAEQVDNSDGSAEPSGPKPSVTAGAPADLAPALVAAADLACATVEMPVHAPGAEVVVHVDLDTFIETAREVDAAEAGPSTVSENVREPAAIPDQSLTCKELPTTNRPAASRAANGKPTAGAARGRTCKGRPTPRRPGKRPRRPARRDSGPSLRATMLQELACDGRIQLSVDGPDGRTLDLGRRRRRPTNRQIVALWRRDRGCAVPGCGRTRFLHAHHVRPWALGGKTNLDNLVLLCGEHHRLLHNGVFSITAEGQQRFRFHGTDGTTATPAPHVTGVADSLTAAHPDITPATIEPDWDGANLHLHDTISTYLTAWETCAAS